MDLTELFLQMEAIQASDLFLSVGKRPAVRVVGSVEELPGEPVEADDMVAFIEAYLPPGTHGKLEHERDLDLGVSLSETERFRINLSYQRAQLSMAVRRVPSGAMQFEDLLIPQAVARLADSPRGLILVTGATGSGKSTTMAAILHHINATFRKHIVTIEDPIEFFHQDSLSVISQREVGTDTLDFHHALKAVVRQNPDVIFIGEMRDLATIQTAISAALTGHLVITTMHTVDVTQTLERIINYFPEGVRDQICQDFALALAGIVSQRLLPRADGNGRVPAFEILVGTPLMKRLIGKRELDEVGEVLKQDNSAGMITFTRSLVQQVKAGLLDVETAARGATDREEFLLATEGMETGVATFRGNEDADQSLNMRKLLRDAVKHGASDLILTVGSPPMIRLDGLLRGFDMDPLGPGDTRKLVFSMLTPRQRATFEQEREIDFALSVSDHFDMALPGGDCRFRVNGFYQKGFVAGSFRMIPQSIPSVATLRIPPVVMRLAKRHQGLVLVTGPTGHGKSTTLAAMIDAINEERPCHIITIEDPIEFVHTSRRAVIEQREVHADTKTFGTALKYVLRQDPDVILIGEMRDTETISAALTAAETGHLVFATLHTNDATQSVDRIIDVFPADRQDQVRTQLASCLEAIIAQRLLPRRDGTGRVAAFEVLLGTMPMRAMIRDKRTHQLKGTMETASRDGMITLESALKILLDENLITRETYLAVAGTSSAVESAAADFKH
ncbi:MAG: PilT/PilU family type 4a pilus ATPase [Victivallales bacterium]|nr:PilT/PilU family type 4a pilus ATPase [Victivallales bacterium]MBT7161655.1 PilT/PilU family type 4a pilus ATPase [Victivallales bacterium]MBT7303315.1 PilT/PilU family type 4a pilus ATPase [Victivallales bacterium]